MPDIFVDGVRAVAVANGVARIELLQLKRSTDGKKLEPQAVATLLLPVGGLREFSKHLNSSLQRIEASQKATADESQATSDVDSALQNL